MERCVGIQWSVGGSGEVLSKLRCGGFRATALSTHDFSTTTLPHNLVKEKLLDLMEWTFKKALKTIVRFVWHVMTERLFSLPLTGVDIHFGHVRMCAMPCPVSCIIFVLFLDSEPSCTDKLLESRRVAPLSWLVCFCSATGNVSWILLTMTVRLVMSRLLVRLLGASVTFWALTVLVLKAWSKKFILLNNSWLRHASRVPGPPF